MPEVQSHQPGSVEQSEIDHDVLVQRDLVERERRYYSKLQAASLIVLATAAVLTLMYFAKPVLIIALVSVLLGFILAPIVDACDRIHLPRWFGSAIAILIFVGICYSIMYFSYNRAVSFMDDLPKYSTRIRETVIRVRQRTERFQKTAENVLPSAPDEKNAVKVKQSSNWADRLTEGAGAVTEL